MSITTVCSSYFNLCKTATCAEPGPTLPSSPRQSISAWKHQVLEAPFHCTALLPVHTQHTTDDALGEDRPEMAAAHRTQRPTTKQHESEQNFSTQNPSLWLKEGPAICTNHRQVWHVPLHVLSPQLWGRKQNNQKTSVTFNRLTSKHKSAT